MRALTIIWWQAAPARLAMLCVCALVVLSAAALPLGAQAQAQAPSGPMLDAPRGDKCILPGPQMRRLHPELLRHQRDRTVRLGERGAQVVLRECIDCHANAVDGSVLGGASHFCQGCHEYVGVRLDCFECHNPRVDRMISVGESAATTPVDTPPLLALHGTKEPGKQGSHR